MEHNLKNIDLEIPRNKLVVITGSVKSSLAFDTICAEGHLTIKNKLVILKLIRQLNRVKLIH